mmetsp:Transcript_33821/g.66538  ORF Transcript_33821/g.66538 Transcript_33821/m.66538 type:complete len:113 (+) Transcript_33821:96-434(+)
MLNEDSFKWQVRTDMNNNLEAKNAAKGYSERASLLDTFYGDRHGLADHLRVNKQSGLVRAAVDGGLEPESGGPCCGDVTVSPIPPLVLLFLLVQAYPHRLYSGAGTEDGGVH